MSVDQNSGGGGGLPEAVSQAYYRYGLFVATHPIKVILLAVIAFLILSSPLYHLPLPGHVPQEYLTPAHNYSIPPPAEGHISLSPSPTPTPLWYQGAPIAYILQVVIRSSVCPVNDSSLTVSDSYRGPLATVFSLYEALSNYEHGRHKFHSSPSSEGVVRPNKTVAGTWLGSECLLVEDVAKQHRGEGGVGGKLPNFNCLLLSPADLWTRDKNEFLNDPHVLTTIKSLMAGHDDESRVADVLFGVPASEVGLLNNDHPKVVTYALTLALRRYNEEFVEGLRSELLRKYPLHKDNQPSDPNIIHLYFPSRLSLWEVLIFLLYCGLFFSVYFSLLKLDILYSKLGISITVLVTLVSSLCLAVGTCAYWGLKPLHTQGKYVYPVLSGLVGFENSMVLMRSIASTPQHLDVKIRVARGLAREGWIITKYFLTMITLVTLSFFLFIPIVQEICIYGSLVLLCDLSMQLVFFIAVLSLDLQRLRDSQKHLKQEMLLSRGWIRSNFSRLSGRHRTLNLDSALNKRSGIANLHRRITSSRSFPGEDRVAPPSSEPTKAVKDVPKRLRLTYCLTGNRTFQRMFICAFVGWIAFIIYSTTGIIDQWERLAETNPGLESVIRSIKTKSSEKFLLDDGRGNARGDEVSLPTKYNKMKDSKGNKLYNEDLNYENFAEKYQHHDDVLQHEESVVDSADGKSSATNKTHLFKLPEKSQKPWTEVLRHVHPDVSSYLPETHWPTLFGYYNITLRGEYISLLPPLLLSVPVSVEEALMVHHPGDPNTEPWKPQASVHTQSPVSENDWWWVSLMSGDSPPKSSPRLGNRYGSRRTPFIPSSSGEMIVTGILAIPALGVMVYSFIWLYRCICSRHYAEWREQWWTGEHPQARAQIIGECVPVSLVGHSSEIECVCSDGSVVASACLSGVIKTWDPVTSECLATISRTKDVLVHHEDHSSDYESGSPRSLPELPAYAEHPPGCIWQLPSQLNSGAPNETCVQSPSVVSSSPLSIRTDFPAMYGCKKAFPSTITNPDVVDVAAQSFNVGQVDRTFRPEESPQINSQSSVPVPITDPIPVNTGTTIAYDRFGKNSTALAGYSCDGASVGASAVWSLHCHEGIVFVGCADGSIEVWDAYSGNFKFATENSSGSGVTAMTVCSSSTGSRLVAARLSGSIDYYSIDVSYTVPSSCQPHEEEPRAEPPSSLSSTSYRKHRRGSSYENNFPSTISEHRRYVGDDSNLAGGGISGDGIATNGVPTSGIAADGITAPIDNDGYVLQLTRFTTNKAHHQSISVLRSDTSRVITGSLDHTLKVLT
ncbi:hypothetical protein HAZT_HAZT007505 [Hyalella azteca]|uniref:Sterol regulatory element-binding protein cleavage-activating protein n=1 Tax=Hyalella azteca TaxID=294128 RepID=A0A6A0GQV1_HYAAZ|nr:hypothetical protein HAZT_HAZT007505 [Hyalella azteca]